MSYRQFAAWRVWSLEPTVDQLLSMQVTQYLDAILHMFDKSYKGKPLSEYGVGPRPAVKVPVLTPGVVGNRVPHADGEWFPHPLTAEEVKRAKSKGGMRSIGG